MPKPTSCRDDGLPCGHRDKPCRGCGNPNPQHGYQFCGPCADRRYDDAAAARQLTGTEA